MTIKAETARADRYRRGRGRKFYRLQAPNPLPNRLCTHGKFSKSKTFIFINGYV